MSDILREAEPLCHLPISGGHFEGRYLDISEIVRGLVAEVKRLRALKTGIMLAYEPTGPITFNGIEYVPKEELARWQQIAIDLKAISYFANSQSKEQVFDLQPNEIQDKYRDRAARELNLRATREAGYVERLEERLMSYMMPTKEQRTSLCEAVIFAEQLNGVVCKDGSIISIDPQLPATFRSLLASPPAWEVTEERKSVLADAIQVLDAGYTD
jgi:hypothetical protein